MNRCFAFATLAVALVLGSAGSANAFFGLGGNGCGCGCEQSCACEQSCGCEKSCGCEQSCGCENSCCHRCCLSGLCDRVRGMFSCHNSCGCCEQSCGCEKSCGCEQNCCCCSYGRNSWYSWCRGSCLSALSDRLRHNLKCHKSRASWEPSGRCEVSWACEAQRGGGGL